MTDIEIRPSEVPELRTSGGSPADQLPAVVKPMGAFTRPSATTGWRSWLTTVDHKKIGIMYGAASLFFFAVGGFEALLIRSQLALPEEKLLNADVYNQVFTMHGVTMVFLFVMPLAAAFANYLLPLQIGARDVAFPRLNALSFWIWIFGALFFNTSWLLGGGANGGWFNYAPNSTVTFSPSHGIDFYSMGLIITGVASLVSAVNLIVTVINLRAPGMTWMRMPVFTWMAFITQVLLLFALPVITVALLLLLFDRNFGSNFFNASKGGDPFLWEHLFWIFGHPEVYIIVLPSFGIVSEIIPTFSRKPIFGYRPMVFSGIAIAFMGFGVWAHHMFASGMGPMSVMAFSMATMFIAVPTGVKVLNWVATMFGGKLRFTSAMMWAVGLVSMFTIGGLSGVSHSFAPADTQQTDTYYIVGHFHYVIFGGGVFGLFAGIYFWWPKVFGYLLDERRGKLHFWVTLVGFNLTFAPMHVLGLQGMSRRIQTYSANQGFTTWNLLSTIGSFVIALGLLIFVWNVAASYAAYRRDPQPVGPDPWDARSLEWMVPSPTPEHNFDTIPVVTELDDFWHRKYGHDEHGRPVRIAKTEDVVQDGSATGVHLPSPSYWPIVMAAALPFVGYGVIFNYWWLVPGAFFLIAAIFGWAMEPADDVDLAHGHGDDGHGDDGHGDHRPGEPVPTESGDAEATAAVGATVAGEEGTNG